MPRIVTPARNITAAVDQWETVQVAADAGVSATFHRRLVTRDGAQAIVGTPGPWVASTVMWADLPASVRNALTTAVAFGETLG